MVSYTKGAGVKPAPFFIAGYLLLQGFTFSVHALAEVPVVEIEDRDAVTSVRAMPATDAASPVSASTSLPAGNRQNQLSEVFVQMQQLQHSRRKRPKF